VQPQREASAASTHPLFVFSVHFHEDEVTTTTEVKSDEMRGGC
jgi:hypothetical protein